MRQVPLTIAILLAGMGAAAPVLAQPRGDEYWPHMMWGGGCMLFGPLFMIFVIAAVVVGVVLLVRWLGGPGQGGLPTQAPRKSPLDILKERFARGEIDKEEFEERRRVLEE